MTFTPEEREVLCRLLHTYQESLESDFQKHPKADWIRCRIEWVKRLAMKIIMG